MKKIRRHLIVVLILVVFLFGGVFVLYKNLVDENTLSISEKKWIDVNVSNVNTITIPNDINIFGKSGKGVFYDFSDYLVNEVGIKINNNPVSYTASSNGYRFEVTSNYDKNGLLMFKDHYVIVSLKNGILQNPFTIVNSKIGVLNDSLEKIATYYGLSIEAFTSYEKYELITNALLDEKIEYLIVPLNEYKDVILSNNLNIQYHISDLNKYYYFKLSDNATLNNIMKKKFGSFMTTYFDESYNKFNYDLFITKLGISAKEEDKLTDKNYKYGFVETKAYEVLASGQYGGITANILDDFSKFSNVSFTYKKSNTSVDLATAAINGDIDIYYNFYNIITNFVDMGAARSVDYYVVAHNDISLNLDRLSGLKYLDVYVQENSILYNEIKNIEGINLITYKTTDELKQVVKKKSIIILDKNIYDNYVSRLTDDYSIRLSSTIKGKAYYFRYKNENDAFYKLFNAYTKTIDPSEMVRKGIISYNKTDAKRNIIKNIIVVLIVIVCGLFGLLLHNHRKANKIKIDTKVKKEDKLKYIDLLTSLKNRNYYYEKLDAWNRNTIYPQACIVLDILDVKELNDTLGHEEGDKQIRGVANILIKTQIDSSEIIRTDGNEFFIYLVGYSEKQVVSYMKKLVKEFKNLPYDNGVAMGFSMIEDDTKLIEDAFNEASIQMRTNKDSIKEKDVKKD